MAPVKRDHMGLPRIDTFEITRIALCKMKLKDWLKVVKESVKQPVQDDEEEETIDFDLLIATLNKSNPTLTK